MSAPESRTCRYTENSHGIDQQVLPTYAVICCPAFGAAGQVGSFNWAMLLHGSQGIRLHAPLPAAGKLSVVTEVADIQDKGEGKNAIIMLRGRGSDPDTGTLIAETFTTLVIRGEGGFGGEPGQRPAAPEIPDREPDARVALTTREDQPLIYRLSGDRNPLHSDPWFAKELAGFPGPIMHGLCTYGFSGRALIAELGNGNASAITFNRCAVHQAGLSGRDADHLDLAHRTRQGGISDRSLCARRQRGTAGPRGRRGGIHRGLTGPPWWQPASWHSNSRTTTGKRRITTTAPSGKSKTVSSRWAARPGSGRSGLSPSHWATLELTAGKDRDKEDKDRDKGKHEADKEDDQGDKDDKGEEKDD